jgi:hypothetical protein
MTMPLHPPPGYRRAISASFPFARDLRFAAVWLPLLALPGAQGVTLTDDGTLTARLGPFHLETPLSNVAGAHVIGPFRWWTAVGPRLSFVDDGLTFGTTNRRGVCVHFGEPVGPVLGRKRHSALTVTVADCAALVQALPS